MPVVDDSLFSDDTTAARTIPEMTLIRPVVAYEAFRETVHSKCDRHPIRAKLRASLVVSSCFLVDCRHIRWMSGR